MFSNKLENLNYLWLKLDRLILEDPFLHGWIKQRKRRLKVKHIRKYDPCLFITLWVFHIQPCLSVAFIQSILEKCLKFLRKLNSSKNIHYFQLPQNSIFIQIQFKFSFRYSLAIQNKKLVMEKAPFSEKIWIYKHNEI